MSNIVPVEFEPWPKIPRGNPSSVTITEKINGTNACVVIQDGEIVAVQSRRRFIFPGSKTDNYGFAGWVERHNDELLSLGEGRHYGEWAGPGIQKNPLKLDKKHFFLFNTALWNEDNPNLPDCCSVVPVVFEGLFNNDTILNLLEGMKADEITREGIVVWYHASRSYTKHTLEHDLGKWCS